MTLFINNKKVEQVLTMEDTIAALEQSYLQLAPEGGVPAAYRHPHSHQRSGLQLPMGHHEGGSAGRRCAEAFLDERNEPLAWLE